MPARRRLLRPWPVGSVASALVTVGVLVLFAGPANGQAREPLPERRVALLLGVERYRGLPQLKHAVDDIVGLRASLIKLGFRAEDVFFLVDDQTTRNNVTPEVKRFAERALAADLLLVAFAGHGFNRAGASYLCPSDAVADLDTQLRLDEIYAVLERSRARTKVVIVDACRTDPGWRPPGELASRGLVARPANPLARGLDRVPDGTDTRTGALRPDHIPSDVWMLISCSDGEPSLEDPLLGHGVFSFYLIRALSGVPPGAPLNPESLFSSTKRGMEDYFRRKGVRGRLPQNPKLLLVE